MMKAKVIPLFAVLLFSASCAGNIATRSYVSRDGSTYNLTPTREGMSLEAAYAAIGGGGRFVPNVSGTGYDLVYRYKLGNYDYRVFNTVSSSKKISSVTMTFLAAYDLAESANECSDFFKITIAELSRKYGAPDFLPRFHNENGNIVSKAIFTFSDSSSVRADYSYPQNGHGSHHCLITIYSAEQWAYDEDSPRLSPVAPMMRTPWSRFK